MKTLNKLNLAYLNRRELDDREMNALRGGNGSSCVCNNCATVDWGDNRSANAIYGYTISGGYGEQPGSPTINCDCPNSADSLSTTQVDGGRYW